MMENTLDKDFMTKTLYSDIQQLFESRKNSSLYNTSYPLSPSRWAQYITDKCLPFDLSLPIAFYIHIPFCKQVCLFCEYTKMCLPAESVQLRYIENTIKDINQFVAKHENIMLYGFDIGGGTPTALSEKPFAVLMNRYGKYIASANVHEDFEASIEATFQTLTPHKIALIAENGIKRISLGIQSTSENILKPLHRSQNSYQEMSLVIQQLHQAGIDKVNIDLMYGLPGQTIDTITRDIETIQNLNPEQVTIYEFRTNQLANSFETNLEICFQDYCKLYEGLTGLGYIGIFGQNTFSKSTTDCGLSSYLRHRMFDGWQYKGFGISSQSMSLTGLSYNIGKNASISNLLSDGIVSYEATNSYILPPQEVFGKFIAISGYSGGFSISAARKILGDEFDCKFQDTINFLLSTDLITIKSDRLQLTKSGFRHYGAVLSLFHSPQVLTD